MTNMVTRCPKCSTSFRITPKQLQVAKGAVRCGSCLHIFKAEDFLVQNPPTKNKSKPKAKAKPRAPTPPPPKAKKAATPAPKKQSANKSTNEGKTDKEKAKKVGRLAFDQALIDDGELIDDNTPIDDGVPDSEETPLPSVSLGDTVIGFHDQVSESPKWNNDGGGSLFEREVQETDADQADNADETWAVTMLEEEEEESSETYSKAFKREVKASGVYDVYDPDDDEDLNNNLDELIDLEEEQVKPKKKATAPKQTVAEKSAAKATQNRNQPTSKQQREPRFSIVQEPEEREREAIAALRPGADSRYLSAFEPEPVEMHWHRRDYYWITQWAWRVGILVAVLLVVVQVGALNFAKYSRIEPYRGWYQTACAVFGCKLPTQVDRNQVRTYNLVIRSHPKIDNALVVDTILLNTAKFQQPFPGLTLSFSDLKGEVVAQRTFHPHEYLSGELAGATRMPSNQPIHLSLEIKDPGSKAVNYQAFISQ